MRKGFTVIEIVVATLVLSILFGGIMMLFKRSNAAFSITLWKQERTMQAERFWTNFRTYIEEASDLFEIPDTEIAKPHPRLKKTASMPLLLKQNPNEPEEKHKILAWNVSNLNFDFSLTGASSNSSNSSVYYLYKEGKKIYLTDKNDKIISQLDDVKKISFVTKPITYMDGERSYTTLDSTTGEVVGTLLEIAITLTPPANYIGEGNEIPQNHKFKLNVASAESSNPDY